MKKALVITSLVAFLILAGLLLAPYFIDVNNYKGQIVSLIKQKTGRDVEIKGEISLRILPEIALKLNDVSVASSVKSDLPLISVSDLVLKMKLMPLLDKRLEIENLKFVKPVINLHVLADGTANWNVPESSDVSLTKEMASAQEAAVSNENEAVDVHEHGSEVDGGRSFYDVFQFRELKISEGNLTYRDDKTGQVINIANINLDTALGPSRNPFAFSAKFNIFEDDKKGNLSLSGQYSLEGSQINVENLEVVLDGIKGTSNMIMDFETVKPTINAALSLGEINLNNYKIKQGEKAKAAAAKEADKATQAGGEFEWSTEQLDLSFINRFEGSLNIKAAGLTAGKVTTGSIIFTSFLRNNKLNASLKKANIYGGDITGEFVIGSRGNSYEIYEKINVSKLDISKLNVKAGIIKSVTGTFDLNLETTSVGRSQKELVSTTKGNINFKAANGVVEGLDLVSIVQNVAAAFNVGGAAAAKTEFSDMSGDFVINNGVMSNDNFVLKSNVMNFSGNGEINLNDLTINYTMTPQITSSATAEADGKALTKIPVLITGKLAKPVFRLEVKSIVEDLINNPKGPENLVKQLKRDFKDMKKGSGEGLPIKELKNIFQ